MVEFLGNFRIGVKPLAEHGFHLRLVGLPDDDAKVSGGEVDVEERLPRVRDEGVLHVGELEAEERNCHG